MPDNIRIYRDIQLISIKSCGNVSREDILESIEMLSKLFNLKTIDKVMIDTSQQEKIPTISNLYELSKKIPYGLKIAIVSTLTQMSYNNLKFFETTSSNKGKMLKVFKSVEEAELWLYNYTNLNSKRAK
ncbi:MAG: hypothetical protein JKY09_02200 [Crocinitomicaceae bacterium]|nr:hypothetical protein [Crocinitomicaceae bacterium]